MNINICKKIVLLSLLVSSCKISGNLVENTEDNILEISQIHQVSAKDFIFSANAIIPVWDFAINKTGIYFDAGTLINFHSLRFGGLNARYNYPFKFVDFNSISYKQEPIQNNFHKGGICAVYSYPIFTKKKDVENMRISFGVIEENSYYGIITGVKRESYNLRLGFERKSSRIETIAYDNYLNNLYKDLQNFNEKTMMLSQLSQCLKGGFSYQRMINSKLKGSGSGIDFIGRRTELLTIYADVSVLYNSKANDVNYRYTAYNPGTYEIIAQKNGPVDLREVIPLHRVGCTFGVEQIQFFTKHHNHTTTQGFEFSLYPGYYEKISQSFYFTYRVTLGLGFSSYKL